MSVLPYKWTNRGVGGSLAPTADYVSSMLKTYVDRPRAAAPCVHAGLMSPQGYKLCIEIVWILVKSPEIIVRFKITIFSSKHNFRP